MKRRPEALADGEFDVAVVGGGIVGACIARDAATRGLRVALVERSDLGGATSFNSLKVIHGGFRYLQNLDLPRLRESVRERRYWLWAAPHLVRPMRCVMPAVGFGPRSPEALRLALHAYGLLARDANRDLPPEQQLPAGRVLSAGECAEAIPGLDPAGIRGGASWYDAQAVDTEHLLLHCLQDAARAGAVVVNYMEARAWLGGADRVRGARCRDALTGDAVDVRARLTICATGPFTPPSATHGAATGGVPGPLVKSMNLVVPDLGVRHAFAAGGGRAGRLFFVTPWRGCSLIGTSHAAYTGDADACSFTAADASAFLEEVRAALPGPELARTSVLWWHGGLLPAARGRARSRSVATARRGLLVDHARTEGRRGLLTVVGEKYTTARSLAERVVDRAFEHLGLAVRPCAVRTRRLPGAPEAVGPSELLTSAERDYRLAPTDAVRELLESYGTRYPAVLMTGSAPRAGRHGPDDAELYRRRCLHAIRDEMAVRLPDLVLRRFDLLVRGQLPDALLESTADLMARELHWTSSVRERELADVRVEIRRHRAMPDVPAGAGGPDAHRAWNPASAW